MEPLQTPEQLQWISNLAHWIEGGMFATVAVIAFIQALGYAQSKGAQYLWPGLVLLAGVFLPVYILLQRGLSGIGVTWSLVIRDPQQREHFLMALLLLAVALAQILLLKAVRPPALWKFLGPAALAATVLHASGRSLARFVSLSAPAVPGQWISRNRHAAAAWPRQELFVCLRRPSPISACPGLLFRPSPRAG